MTNVLIQEVQIGAMIFQNNFFSRHVGFFKVVDININSDEKTVQLTFHNGDVLNGKFNDIVVQKFQSNASYY